MNKLLPQLQSMNKCEINEQDRYLAECLIKKYKNKIKKKIEEEKQETNTHHLVPRSRWWSNSKNNLRTLNAKYHTNWHRIFNNKTPVEQLFTVINENWKVFTSKFRKSLMSVLAIYNGKEYRDWVFK